MRAVWLLVVVCSCSLPRPGVDGVLPVVEDADGDGSPAVSDCDEANAAVHPNADEVCNGIDDNCDGVVDDDALDRALVYTDADWDGFGVGDPALTCATSSSALVGGDCDDTDSDVYPGACEHPADGVDTDCDGLGDSELPVAYFFDDRPYNEVWFQTAEPGPVAVRFVGTEGYSFDDSLERTVHVTASKPMILVLASDDPIQWTVDEAAPGTVQRVIVSSTTVESTVTGIDAPVETYWGADRLFDDDDALGDLDAALFREVGIHLTSRGDSTIFDQMTLADEDAWTPESTEWASWQCPDDTPFASPRTDILPEDCRSLIVAGTPACLTTVGSWAWITQPDGDLCKIQLSTGSKERPGSSVVWRGDSLYFCASRSDQVGRLRLSDLEVQLSFQSCESVTDWNDRIVVQDGQLGSDGPLETFGTWGDVNSGNPIESYPDAPDLYDGDAFAIEGDILYMAVGDSVSRFTLDSQFTPLDPITLEGFEDSITGMDVTGDGDILVVDGAGYLRTFDSEGHAQSAALIYDGVRGLSCFTP